jgi:hypothetical protein
MFDLFVAAVVWAFVTPVVFHVISWVSAPMPDTAYVSGKAPAHIFEKSGLAFWGAVAVSQSIGVLLGATAYFLV